MNDTHKLYATAHESLQTGLRQWRDAAQAWNDLWVEATQASLETWLKTREQAGQAWFQAAGRTQEMLQREQALWLQAGEQLRAHAKANAEIAGRWTETWNEAGRTWTAETGRAVREQTTAAQAQVGQMWQQATDVQTQVGAMLNEAAETMQAAMPANGARARTKGN